MSDKELITRALSKSRNLDKKPYSRCERRVAKWIADSFGVGGGDDPIGFLMISHQYLAVERNNLKKQVKALQDDYDRLDSDRQYYEEKSG